ncbi:MAG TPA: TonB-dependent receptor plug domain-containing protein, partial [Hanamia sp.]|nr:TonB-dependent receptor plug domain-containing protein [Hanamia sp.]
MKPALLLLLICWTATANTQSRVISGKIRDAVTKSNIRFCSLQLLNFNPGGVSDENGNFKLEIPVSILYQKIIISAAGYITDTAWLSPEKNEYLFYLAAYEQPLDAVVITGVSKATLIRENPISISRVSSKAIEQTNESNIIDVLVKNVPGLNAVKTGPNISKPFIRGLGYNRVLT